MHKDLEAWLNQVWSDKTRIIGLSPTGHSGRGVHLGNENPAIWAVYKMYNASAGDGPTSSDVSAVPEFIDELDNLEKTVGCAATLQVSNDFVQLNRGQLSNVKTAALDLKTQKTKKPVRVDRVTVGRAFVHFVKSNDDATKHRVYVNVRRPNLGSAFRNIMAAIWSEGCLHSAKVAGPLSGSRADSVVIYLSDGSRDSVMAKIRAYYDKNKSHFGATTPKLTVPVDGMPGVALGMEPPGLAVIRSGSEYYAEEMGQSFGFYRAMLIFMALDRTHFTRPGQTDQQRCAAFKNRAAKYFTHAGIDPDRPAEQSEPKDLKPIEELDRSIQGEPDDVGGVQVVIRR